MTFTQIMAIWTPGISMQDHLKVVQTQNKHTNGRTDATKRIISLLRYAGSEITGFPRHPKMVLEIQNLGLGFRLETLGKFDEHRHVLYCTFSETL